ncbi:MAG: 50S ribosomal protein L32 [Patescibacteria group bacterium]
MAEPKKRTNRPKRDMRRMHDRVSAAAFYYCEKCHQPKERHRVCLVCGTYKGVQVLER